MTDLNKRSLFKALAISAAAAATLAACGKKEEAPAAAAPAQEPAAASAPAPAKPEPLKVAFAYVGPVGDGGWSFAHDNARKAVEKEFGDRIQTSYVESVPESADAERVIRDMVSQGNKLVFGTTFGYMEPMLKVAADHPEVEFVRPCNLCPHMKRITLPAIRQTLEQLSGKVEVDAAVADRARLAIERMLAV